MGNRKNETARSLKFIGGLIIVVGFISSYLYMSSTRFLASTNMVIFLAIIFGGIVQGCFFFGMGEIVNLLHSIKNSFENKH